MNSRARSWPSWQRIGTNSIARAEVCSTSEPRISRFLRLPLSAGSWQEQLEGGRGFAVIRGLPVQTCSEDQAALLFWGLSVHVGTPEPQDRAGNLLHHVQDTGQDLTADDVRKYQTNQEIPFHNDGSDIFMLLCLRGARQGGRSRLVSSTTVFNEIVGRRPDLAEILQQPLLL